jgi:hypothetical protein
MFSSISAELANERERELRRHVRGRRALAAVPKPHEESREVTIRVAVPGDRRGLARLAELDSQERPSGYVLVAEVGGELVAALPVSGGPAVADPFRHTAQVVALLEMRAQQLRVGEVSPTRATASRSIFALAGR